MHNQKLSIIIPAYNEARTIHFILDKIQNVTLINEIEKEIILVNDCSSDNTNGAILKYIEKNPNINIQYYQNY